MELFAEIAKANLKKMFIFAPRPSEYLFQSEPAGTLTILFMFEYL